MIRIMFVCHGNICRSPMAEFMFKAMLTEGGLSSSFSAASCAVSTEELGGDIYPPAKRCLQRHGTPFSHRQAVQLTRADYAKYDLFIGMDSSNLRRMRSILNGDPENKCRLLMEYTKRGGDVSDPYYTGDFEEVYNDLKEGCSALLDALSE